MKKVVLFIILLNFSVFSGFGQKIVPVQNTSPEKAEISETEWRILTDAMQLEDWDKSAFLASRLLEKIHIDNDKKQLAQLRYFYLIALAGKVNESAAAKKTLEEKNARNELSKAVENLRGKEILLFPRQFRKDCRNSVNYVCSVMNNDKALRITTTNQKATTILSFDYVQFDDQINFREIPEKRIFLGGILQKLEVNENLSKPWIIRLTFEKGFISLAENDQK